MPILWHGSNILKHFALSMGRKIQNIRLTNESKTLLHLQEFGRFLFGLFFLQSHKSYSFLHTLFDRAHFSFNLISECKIELACAHLHWMWSPTPCRSHFMRFKMNCNRISYNWASIVAKTDDKERSVGDSIYTYSTTNDELFIWIWFHCERVCVCAHTSHCLDKSAVSIGCCFKNIYIRATTISRAKV